MFSIFKKPLEEFTPWQSSPVVEANGFCVLPVERTAAERGPHPAVPGGNEKPQGGSFAWGLPSPATPDNWVCAVLAGVLPREGGKTLAEAKATWVSVLRVDGVSKRQAREVQAIIGEVPTRIDVVNGDLLVPYSLPAEISDPRCYGLRAGNVSCLSGPASFLVSGPRWKWEHGSPLTTHRDQLPELTWQGAHDLVATLVAKAAA
jgi:hypothetical protein